MGDYCYSIVRKPKNFEYSNELKLKKRIEGDDMEKSMIAIEEILQNLLDGMKFCPSLMMPIINRYQMNIYQPHAAGFDKRIKKLLYLLWECLPKRGPDGKFLDKLVLVCGAFDKDLKHPNQFVCGSVLRTLSKTREYGVIRELVNSIERCLDLSHAYQRKNAVLAIAKIYKNFPDLNPHAPKMIAEYLLKENDDECKRAALQALLDIDPEEAKAYLHSCNISDIHCMNASIQLLFVELIQRVFKKGSEDYLIILTSLIKSTSSPSVRYQAALTLMRFTRDPESIKLAASCFIDICAKDSDNNIRLISLDSLMNLRRINGAERVLPDKIMDILSILQSAKDLELHEKILRLALDLLSPLNVGDVVVAMRQEMKKMVDSNIFSSPQETMRYGNLLVTTVHRIAERFPQSIADSDMIDTLFDLLMCKSIGDKTAARLILLFKVFMANNPQYQTRVLEKAQDKFNIGKNNSSILRGLVQILGDFSETKEQINRSYEVIKDSISEKIGFAAPSVALALSKMGCRYVQVVSDTASVNNLIARFMMIITTMLKHEGYHSENLMLCLTILQSLVDRKQSEVAMPMKKIITDDLRSQLSAVVKNIQVDRLALDDEPKKLTANPRFDDDICISLFHSPDDEFEYDIVNGGDENRPFEPSSFPDLTGEIPLTGSRDKIYAYCVFDINQYDIGLKVYLENKTESKTLENVSLELSASGEGFANLIDRPDPVVLAPKHKVCIETSIKVVSTENRRLFGCIAFDDLSSDDREDIIVLNDISINIIDYIKPYNISFDEFRDIWRDCEWENKVTVKTKQHNLKDYLSNLVRATNMRCVTSDRGLSGDCLFLSANLYAKSNFGEEALVNVSIEKDNANAFVTGNVKIRSRSQGMALSLGEKIQSVQ